MSAPDLHADDLRGSAEAWQGVWTEGSGLQRSALFADRNAAVMYARLRAGRAGSGYWAVQGLTRAGRRWRVAEIEDCPEVGFGLGLSLVTLL